MIRARPTLSFSAKSQASIEVFRAQKGVHASMYPIGYLVATIFFRVGIKKARLIAQSRLEQQA
jgi:hypothetical protein